MNEDDRREIEALAGLEPTEALLISLDGAEEAWTARLDGQPMCMWGVNATSLIGYKGVPWLLGSDLIQRHPMVFLRHSRQIVARWRGMFPELRNYVDARHHRSIRWLRWLGFTIEEARPLGVAGLPFHPFEMRT